MKTSTGIILSFITAVALAVAVVSLPALALGEGGPQGALELARGDGVPTNLMEGDGSLVRRIINFMLIGIAIISVVMLIVGGFRYVVSGGQKEAVNSAKNTILYAIVGLLIALFAYAIIKFVVNVALSGGSSADV